MVRKHGPPPMCVYTIFCGNEPLTTGLLMRPIGHRKVTTSTAEMQSKQAPFLHPEPM